MRIFQITACMLLAVAEGRRPSKPYSSASKPSSSASKPSSSASKPSSSSSYKPSSSSSSASKPSSSSSNKPSSSSSSASKPSSYSSSKPSSSSVSKPTTSSGNKYSYKGVSSAMKTSGWSSKAKKASGAYLAYLAAKKAAKVVKKVPKLWTGYGYEGDDEWQEYSPISSCFSCTSYNGDNMACERPDDSYSISRLGQVSCPDSSHYCGFTLGGYGETGDNVFLERGCFAKTLYDSAQCSIPNDVESKWSITEEFEMSAINTHCDYCDSNNCNGWTLRALPDDQFDSGSPLTFSIIILSLSLLLR